MFSTFIITLSKLESDFPSKVQEGILVLETPPYVTQLETTATTMA